MYSLRRPSPGRLAALREQQRGLEVTYRQVGASLGELPAGYDTAEVRVGAGHGNTALLHARRAIRDWAGHAHVGIVLEPQHPPIEEGTVLALGAPLFGLWVAAACRIVRVVDTEDVFGFAYGTLPHHVEIGEECFLAERGPDGAVEIVVRVFSNPATGLARAGGPLSLRVRDRILRRYAVGLAGAALGRAGR